MTGDTGETGTKEPTAESLFDPVDFERRLTEARVRRDAVLAARARSSAPQPTGRSWLFRGKLPAPGRGTALLAGMFLFGLCSGLTAAVILRDRPPAMDAAAPVAATALMPRPSPNASVPLAFPSRIGAAARPDSPVPLGHSTAVASAEGNFPHTILNIFAPTGTGTNRTVRALESAGFSSLTANSVQLPISRTNVRYYHAEDRTAAVRARDALTDSGATVRDFTHAASRPDPGTLEIWLAGTSPTVTRSSRQIDANPGEVIAGLVSSAARRTTRSVNRIERVLTGKGKLKTMKPKRGRNQR